MTIDNENPTEETTVTPAADETLSPVAPVESTEDLEEKGFNAATDALIPDADASPLEDPTEPQASVGATEGGAEKTDAETEQAAEEVAAAIKPFIGELSEDQVLEMLGNIEGMESTVYEKVAQKVFGKFGEIGQQLKALNEREFTFDPEKLTKLREVDSGIADALADDLKEAFKGQQFDGDAVLNDFKQSLMGDLNPYIEERLLTALAPDAGSIVKTDEFNEWFFKEAKQDVRDAFESWDKRERMDGVAMAAAFTEFNTWKGAKAEKAVSKKTALKRSLDDGKTTNAVPAARRPMTEEEAFNTRLNEGR